MCPRKCSRRDSSSNPEKPRLTFVVFRLGDEISWYHPPPRFPLNLCVSGRNNNVPTEGTPVIQTIKTYCGSKNDPLTERKLPCEWDSSPTSAVAVFLSPASLSCFSVSDDHARLFMIQLFVPQPTGNICTMSHSRSEWKDLKHSENKSECWRRRPRQGQLAAGKKGGTDETEKRRKQDGERDWQRATFPTNKNSLQHAAVHRDLKVTQPRRNARLDSRLSRNHSISPSSTGDCLASLELGKSFFKSLAACSNKERLIKRLVMWFESKELGGRVLCASAASRLYFMCPTTSGFLTRPLLNTEQKASSGLCLKQLLWLDLWPAAVVGREQWKSAYRCFCCPLTTEVSQDLWK